MRIKALDAPNEIIKKGWQAINVGLYRRHGFGPPASLYVIEDRLDKVAYNPGRFYAHIGQAERLWSFNRDSFEVSI